MRDGTDDGTKIEPKADRKGASVKTEITIRRVADPVELASLCTGDWFVYEPQGECRTLGQYVEETPRGIAAYFPNRATIVHLAASLPVYRVRSLTAEY